MANSSNTEDSGSEEKWWDTDILYEYDAEAEDWVGIVDRLSPIRTEDGSPPMWEQRRFWYLQLQPKQRWAYSVYREASARGDGAA
ncbi:MAG: hypothetical protein ACRDKJ_00010 [Actinomycetota bacterium]